MKITNIRLCSRPVRVTGRAVLDVGMEKRYFSMWIHAAGAEPGLREASLSMQLNREMAKKLRTLLDGFLEQASE